MAQFVRHLFVCTNTRPPDNPRGCCASKDSEKVLEALKVELKKAGAADALGAPVRAQKAGCLEQCEHGVTVVVYPDAVWYGFVKPEDAAEIVRSHVIGGTPVERLRLPPECQNTKACVHRPAPPAPLISLASPK
jgi:(2Fe-2S) ferredoxin